MKSLIKDQKRKGFNYVNWLEKYKLINDNNIFLLNKIKQIQLSSRNCFKKRKLNNFSKLKLKKKIFIPNFLSFKKRNSKN